MKEVEVKILNINPEEIRNRLLGLGAEKIFKGPVSTTLFDFPGRLLKKNGGHLRMRRAGKKAELTYKGGKESKQFKKRHEIGTAVEDYDSMSEILKKLGLKEIKSYSKIRESYRLRDMRFDIDIYPKSSGVPPLVEVESTEEGVKEGVSLLGFQMKDTSTASIWDLLDYAK